jgi:hypothetical protein
MKISYRTHPILKLLRDTNPVQGFVIGEEETPLFKSRLKGQEEFVFSLFDSFKSTFLGNVRYITDSFFEAAILAEGKMLSAELIDEFMETEIGGTYLLSKKRAFSFYNNSEFITLFCFSDDILVGVIVTSQDVDNDIIYASSDFTRLYGSMLDAIATFSKAVIVISNFIKYAPVETKNLPAGQKVKGIDCKYINETSDDITITDCTWFTNLVKSDGFKVRGHFRLQPKKKDGEWTKELIWIKDFEKSGYTRQAGILKAEGGAS